MDPRAGPDRRRGPLARHALPLLVLLSAGFSTATAQELRPPLPLLNGGHARDFRVALEHRYFESLRVSTSTRWRRSVSLKRMLRPAVVAISSSVSTARR